MVGRTRKPLTIFLFLILFMGLLSAALWQYHQMMVAIYDGATLSFYQRLLRPFQMHPEGFETKPVRIALLHRTGPLAGSMQDAESAEARTREWERHLAQQGFGTRRIGALHGMRDLTPFNLLVLASVPTISDAELALIKQYMRQGNGLLMSWAVDTRDTLGHWRASSLLRDVAGLDLGPPVPESAIAERAQVSLNARSPLMQGIEPGFTLMLTRFDQPLSATVRERRTTVAGAWQPGGRGMLGSPIADGFDPEQTVVAHGEYLGGRFVWLGFTLASSVPEAAQRQVFDQLLRNAVVWTTRQPVAYKQNWPEDVSSAFSLAWTLREPTDFDARIPALAAQHRAPLTSYLSPALLDEAPAWMQELSDAGPVGLLLPGGTEEPPREVLLRQWYRRLESLRNNGTETVGCLLESPPEDDALLDLLTRVGFDFVAGSGVLHGLPRIVRTHRRIPVLTRAHELWMLPDTPLEIVEAAPDANAFGLPVLDRVFDGIHARGGMLHLSLRADRVDDARIAGLDAFLSRLRRYRVWITDADAVVRYYRLWGHIRIVIEYPTPGRYVIQVSNTGTRSVSDVPVFVKLPSPRPTLEISPTTLGTPTAHAFSEDQRSWRFDIARIPAGKTYIYHIYR